MAEAQSNISDKKDEGGDEQLDASVALELFNLESWIQSSG